jgi:D-glycero-alpha-D-manno-heptose-7-phosphate kinase
MIISRTPFRISFVGGGTDLRSFYSREPGQVLSTSIDKYLYVLVRKQIGLVEYKYKINYSKVEYCKTIDEIEHPIVREALKMFEVDDTALEIATFADIPASTGLGSSSAFGVGLVNALCALHGRYITKAQMADLAAKIEVDRLGRSMGKQDHYASACGNFNIFTFNADESVDIEPVFYRPEVKNALQKNLMLFYTGIKHDASEILKHQQKKTADKMTVLREMKNQVIPLREMISSGSNLHRFGEILHQGWMLKKSITSEISSPEIDRCYEKALAAGAIGGKLLGAGGGGFLLLYVEPQNQARVERALGDLLRVDFGFDTSGSRIVYYDQDPGGFDIVSRLSGNNPAVANNAAVGEVFGVKSRQEFVPAEKLVDQKRS